MRSRGKSIRCEEIRMEWLLFLVRDFLGGGVGFLAPVLHNVSSRVKRFVKNMLAV